MTTGSDAPPTELIRLRAPAAPETAASPYAAATPVWVSRIEDRIGSLTAAGVVLAIVSLAALGISI